MIWDSPYFQNVVSDFLTLGILVGLGGAVYRLSRRKSRLEFFGCASSRKLTIYLSNLQITRWSALDSEGQPRSYSGSAVPGYEVDLVAPAYGAFLAPMPGLEDQQGFLRSLALRDLELRVQASPHAIEDVTALGAVIAVGSAGYNIVSALAEDPSSKPFAKLDPAGAVNIVDGGGGFSGADYALIEKLYNAERGQWLFYVAGSTVSGTTAAYFYLLNDWKALSKLFGASRPFLCVLGTGGSNTAASRIVHSVVGDAVEDDRGRLFERRQRS